MSDQYCILGFGKKKKYEKRSDCNIILMLSFSDEN